jgi:DNA recombination protein RmuC
MADPLTLLALLTGFALGLAAAFALRLIQGKTAKDLAEELFRESEAQRRSNFEGVLTDLKACFGSLSLDALSKSTEEFLKLAKSRLDSERVISARDLEEKKGLIDQTLQRMRSELEGVSDLVKDLEKDRAQKFGELSSQLRATREQTEALMQTTGTLREALASTRVRGQWGERMAEDVLRLAGLLEGVNYLKQKTVEGIGTRPDFTFLLPRNLTLNMDVKFPLDNYLRYLEAQTELEKTKYRNDFLKDVKLRIREVATREYINPEQNTVDYVLLFIPNEQIYAFIQEQDREILDNGIKTRVILCSPFTLFAVLAVIRQAVDNFAIEQTSTEILSLLGAFRKQWDLFVKKMDTLGRRIEEMQKEYESLTSTRRRQLEKPLHEIESLRIRQGIPSAASLEEDPLAPDQDGQNPEMAPGIPSIPQRRP